ncbi:MAG: hypothetical protein M1833_001417 [Piccolia ochrophora]|nr:MAG: hypothetical protein M1833_001417 [Piccolia ochrophora]
MLVVSMLVLLLSSAVGILVQLSKTVEAYPADRTAANRMVCYLTLTAVFLALTVPFFVQLSLGQRAILTSRVATFAFNMYGLLTSILYLVLRFTIAESSDSDHEPHRRSHERFRFFGSADASYVKHITSPVSATPLMTDEKATSPRECNWPLSQARKPSVRQGVAMSEPKEHVRRQRTSSWRQHIIPKRSLSVDVVKPNLPSPPKATISPVSPLTRRPSYSIFPSGTATVSRKGSVSAPQPTLDAVASLPPPLPSKAAEFVPPPLKVRIPEQYKLPPPPSFHRRNMSEASESSTTTVQIGLRLSNAPLPLDLQTPKPQPQPSKLSSTPIIGSPNSDKSLPPSPHIVEWAGLTQTRQHRLRPEIVQLGRSHTRAAKTSGKDWI